MTTYRIRNPEHLDGCRRFRDLGRAQLGHGLVITDVDVLIQWYGPRFDLDADGCFALLEIKHGRSSLTPGQRSTFGLLDRLLWQVAPDRYLGLHVLEDHDPLWRWQGEDRFYCDDELVAELLSWPRGLAP